MLRHYLEVKAAHPDAVLLYRMGDFYELFFDDARKAAPILEVTLTARQKGTENEAPMCGVPHHALGTYLAKLLRAGLKVAICDQVEDPAKAKGLVKREVTRVVTPGTLTDLELLPAERANWLASVAWNGDRGAGAFLDISTGDFMVRRWRSLEEVLDDLALMSPGEVLVPAAGLPSAVEAWIEAHDVCRTVEESEVWRDARRASRLLREHFGTSTLKGFEIEEDDAALRAAAAALSYARATQKSELRHVQSLMVGESSQHLVLDAITLANLEVFANLRDGRKKGSLLFILDRTSSPPGGRRLRHWLQRPLRDLDELERRQDAVEDLLSAPRVRQRLREELRQLGDPERVVSRAVLGVLHPREAGALRDGLERVPSILAELAERQAPMLRRIAEVDPLADLATELERTLEPDLPATLKDGGVIRSGVDEDLDRHRSLARDSRKHVLELEAREREAIGVASLKIRFNKVFGYFIEVSKSNQHRVPDRYVRKQTLVNSERFITEELKSLEERILAAEEEQIQLERDLFERLERRIEESGPRISRLVEGLSSLDVLVSLAEVAAQNRYARPRLEAAGAPIEISEGRHPVVEKLGSEPFVPNDTLLESGSSQIVILTGPNMGGKSTYLRQTAVMVLMAQIGSFVPATAARIGVVDRIFTRVGASDDLSRGESTFMVEMIETAKILHQCTENSLVILDEVGRGTATFDGLSLAWAIVEHLHAHRRPKTLFATHYHELTELSSVLPRVVNRTLAVKEWEDKIVFLRRVVPGSSDKSYGLHVARLAGIPEAVIDRAAQILENLEQQEYDLSGKPRLARGGAGTEAGPDQLTLFAPPEEIVASILADLDLERVSPLAALNLLHALKSRLSGE